MPRFRLLGLALTLALSGCAPAIRTTSAPLEPALGPTSVDGVMVMAHGGSPAWDEAVNLAVAPLRQRIPTALALGMADPRTLQAGLDSLAERGVTRVAVVRLFLSGASFLHQTQYLLGLRGDPPADPMLGHAMGHGAHGTEALRPVRHAQEILLSMDGLAGAEVASRILQDRARTAWGGAGEVPRVLLLAHGMGAESENQEVLRDMGAVADALRGQGFNDVAVATLREDWPEERARAESWVREWVSAGGTGNGTVVVPFRLFGFGPYAQVLEGLSYRSTEGLLPHPLVADWVEAQARSLLCARGGATALGPCGSNLTVP